MIGGVSHPLIFQLAGRMRPATHRMAGVASCCCRFDVAVVVAMVSTLVAGISLITGAPAFGQEGPAPLFTARPAPIGGLDLNVQFQTEIKGDRSAPRSIASALWAQEPALASTPFSLALGSASIHGFKDRGLRQLALRVLGALPATDEEAMLTRARERWELLEEQGRWDTLITELTRRFEEQPGSEFLEVGLRLSSALLMVAKGSRAQAVSRALLAEGQFDPGAVQEIRRNIIKAYIAQGLVADAEIAAQRYQLEYAPDETSWQLLRARIALAGQRPKDAVFQLIGVQSYEAQLWRAYAEWRSGALPIDLALTRLDAVLIPAELVRLESTRHAMLAEVASEVGYARLHVAAIEYLLLHKAKADPLLPKQDSDSLIKSYRALGQTVLKDLSLLDDQATTAWKTLATGGDLDALAARSLCVYLLTLALPRREQQLAHSWLVRQLLEQGYAGLLGSFYGQNGLLGHYSDLEDETLLLLVDQALAESDFGRAADLQSMIDGPPQGVNHGAWVLRSARLQILGGNAGGGAAELKVWLAQLQAIAPASLDQVMQVMFDLQFLGKHRLALELFQVATPLVQTPGQKRELLYWVAQSWAELGDHIRSAAYFVESAAWAGATADPWSRSALYRAGQELESGALYDDAGVIYHQLLGDTTDPKLQAKLRYRLAQLQLGRLRAQEGN